MRNFENLRIWQDSRVFVNEIFNLFENSREYGLMDQIKRASISIMNNIAEGSESGTDNLYCRYLNIAKGSCAEVKSMLYICEDLKICDQIKAEELRVKSDQISSGIYKFLNYLKNPSKNL